MCGKLPVLDPGIRSALDVHGPEELFLTAPVRWMDDENGDMMALGVGSIDGHERKERMAVLHSDALETLTRSSTHQGQADTARTQSQPAQEDILEKTDRNSTLSSSRPQSQHQQTQKGVPEKRLNDQVLVQEAKSHKVPAPSPPSPTTPVLNSNPPPQLMQQKCLLRRRPQRPR